MVSLKSKWSQTHPLLLAWDKGSSSVGQMDIFWCCLMVHLYLWLDALFSLWMIQYFQDELVMFFVLFVEFYYYLFAFVYWPTEKHSFYVKQEMLYHLIKTYHCSWAGLLCSFSTLWLFEVIFKVYIYPVCSALCKLLHIRKLQFHIFWTIFVLMSHQQGINVTL